MVNRILLSAAITLALTFSPNLAFSVPTKTVKKKTSKSPEKVAKKTKSTKSSKSTRRTRSYQSRSEDVVESSMVPSYPERRTVTETPPLMKVTPQRDGRFLLEPLSPKKPQNTPLPSRPSQRSKAIASLRTLKNIIRSNPGISPS